MEILELLVGVSLFGILMITIIKDLAIKIQTDSKVNAIIDKIEMGVMLFICVLLHMTLILCLFIIIPYVLFY